MKRALGSPVLASILTAGTSGSCGGATGRVADSCAWTRLDANRMQRAAATFHARFIAAPMGEKTFGGSVFPGEVFSFELFQLFGKCIVLGLKLLSPRRVLERARVTEGLLALGDLHLGLGDLALQFLHREAAVG